MNIVLEHAEEYDGSQVKIRKRDKLYIVEGKIW